MTKLKKISCTNCKKPIYRSAGRINENLKLGHNFYCSKRCESQCRSKKRLLFCEHCGKSFMRTPHAISLHNYCSMSCAAKTNNKKYPKRQAETKTCANVKCGKQFKKSKGNLKYCSIKCRGEAKWYTPEQVLEIIKNTAQKLGRVPVRRELERIDSTCRRFFGSWNNAVIAAGLQPNRSHNQRMYKRANAKAIDGHLCDSASEAIIDNWLSKNKINHQINVPYPKTNYKADWAINFKKRPVFIEYFGLAKDSPRYDRTVKKKKNLCRKHNLELIEIYPRDLYPKLRLNEKLENIMKKFNSV